MSEILQSTYLSDNVFAAILRGRAPAHRIYEDRAALAFLDIAPQGPGHTLVIPKEDAANLFALNPVRLSQLMSAVQTVGRMLETSLRADGLEVQQLNGSAAGQTVFHLHFHLIPRFDGVPIIPHSEARVVAQAELAEMVERILAGQQEAPCPLS